VLDTADSSSASSRWGLPQRLARLPRHSLRSSFVSRYRLSLRVCSSLCTGEEWIEEVVTRPSQEHVVHGRRVRRRS